MLALRFMIEHERVHSLPGKIMGVEKGSHDYEFWGIFLSYWASSRVDDVAVWDDKEV